MESTHAQDIAQRDQLWASLRGLHSEIGRLADESGHFDQAQQELAVLLARIVLAELNFRCREGCGG